MAKEKKKPIEEAIQELPIIKFLEERTKVGFRTQVKNDKEDFEPLFRLVCDDPDPDKTDPIICTPYCTAQALTTLVQGFLYLNPIIGKILHDAHKNASVPSDDHSSIDVSAKVAVLEDLIRQGELDNKKNGCKPGDPFYIDVDKYKRELTKLKS